MKILLIVSKADEASLNIYEHLKKFLSYSFIDIKIIEEMHIYHNLNVVHDYVIFLSKHSSKAAIKALTLHHIGNFRNADFGGKPETLVYAPAALTNHLFHSIKKVLDDEKYKKIKEEFDLTLEATHHGPYVNKPSVFVEIGSTENEWNDAILGEIWALALKNAFNNINKLEEFIKLPTAIYIGGMHYSKATKYLHDYNVGHICAKYNFPITKVDIEKMINGTIPKPEFVLVEKKGVKEKQKLLEMLEDLKKEYNFEVRLV